MTDLERAIALSRPDKIKAFNDLADRGEVFVHINLDTFGVRIPERLRNQNGKQLILKFSKRYEYQIEIAEEGVSQNLSFQGEWFEVFVAWDAVFCIREESRVTSYMWPDSMPESLKPKADAPPTYLN